MTKINNWLNLKNLIALVAGVAFLYLLVNSLVDIRFRELELSTRAQISDQEKLLVTIAETTARNGADKITESIVIDCATDERNRFDTLLDQLNTQLPKSDLVELERLFGRCGTFYSLRKSVMVTRLARETEIYADYVNQLSIITKEDQSEIFKVATWQALTSEERNQSDEFSQLVRLQDRIITALLAGNTADSTQITDILSEVQVVQQALSETKAKANVLKGELSPL